MSDLIPFQFENKEIRTFVENGEVWVVVADIAKAIEHVNSRDLIKLADKDDVEKFDVIDSLGRKQQAWAANESGLYQILLSTTVEKAKPFRKWVTSEVLPSIRKHGKYEAEKPAKPSMLATDALLGIPAYAESVKSIFPSLGERSLQEIISRAVNEDIGYPLLPQPTISEPFYTATQIAAEFRISANKIGRLANAFGLKTEAFGEYRLSKSKHSAKQVEQFHYNERGHETLAQLLGVAASV